MANESNEAKVQAADGRPAPKPVITRQAHGASAGEASDWMRDFVDRRFVHFTLTSMLMLLGGVLGLRAGFWVADKAGYSPIQDEASFWFNVVGVTVLGSLLGFLVSASLFRKLIAFIPRLAQTSFEDKIAAIFGIVLGLIVAVLLQPFVRQIATIGAILQGLVYVFGIFFGVIVGISMKKELVRMFSSPGKLEEAMGPAGAVAARPKLMDTNVIIDGRILDICQSGFLDGELVVPQFVLDELQTIADSADELKRARGRRGLDLLNRLKGEVTSFRVLRPRDYATPVGDVQGVDGKLVKLAGAMDAALLTNDYNLSKVAELQGISVLNVNRLTIALKPVVLAGEELRVNIIRPGRDPGQGVAYLDDGTMVVVEDGDQKIGRVVDVVVSSMLQTVAGKMIFAALKDGSDSNGARHASAR